MNNLGLTNIHTQAKAGMPSDNVLDMLANQLTLDPEMLKMLQDGTAENLDFETLFSNTKEATVNEAELLKLLEAKIQEGGPEVIKNLKEKLPLIKSELQADQNTIKEALKLDSAIKNNTQMQASTKTNVDVQNKVLDFNQVINRQNAAAKQGASPVNIKNVYKDVDQSLLTKKMDMATTNTESSNKVTSLQDIMFGGQASDDSTMNMNQSFKQETAPQTKAVSNEAKVFDMNMVDSKNTTDEIISKIKDYMIQNKVSQQKSVDFSFNHKELGQIDMNLQKMKGDAVNISIGTMSVEGGKFFTQNQGELLQSLAKAGVQVNDFKLETGKSSSGEFSNESSKQFSQNQNKGHQSQSGERREDQTRRQNLWNQFQDKEAA